MKQGRVGAQSHGWRSWLRRATGRALLAMPELGAARLESNARKLGPAAIPQLFSRDLRRLDPAFNEELLEFAGRAELILRNRFTFLNQTQEFNRQIGWESSPSRAWRAELHSFDFGLDLAVMYRVSGEERFLKHLRYLMADWIGSNPPLETAGWEMLPLARRIRNWILAFDLARDVWQTDAEFAQVATRSLALQCVCLEQTIRGPAAKSKLPEAAVALLLSSRLFKPPAGSSHRTLALRTLREMVEADLPASGARQPSPAARVRLARSMLEFILFEPAWRPEDSQWLKASLELALRAVEEILLADGLPPSFGSEAAPHSEALDDLFAASAVILDSGWAKGIGQNFGILSLLLLGQSTKDRFSQLAAADWSPSHIARSPACFYRLAGPTHSSLTVTAASPTQSGHQDFLSYELMLRGMRVVVDSGSVAPPGEDEGGYFPTALAHNVLMLDGALASISADAELATCTADLAENPEYTRLRIMLSAGPDISRRERIFFSLADGAWIVLDRVLGAQPHSFWSLIHLFPTFKVELYEGFAIAKSLSLSLAVIPFGSSPAVLAKGHGDESALRSWYSPDYGIRYESSALACQWESLKGNWAGGYLIMPAPNEEIVKLGISLQGNELLLESGGNQRRLPLGKI